MPTHYCLSMVDLHSFISGQWILCAGVSLCCSTCFLITSGGWMSKCIFVKCISWLTWSDDLHSSLSHVPETSVHEPFTLWAINCKPANLLVPAAPTFLLMQHKHTEIRKWTITVALGCSISLNAVLCSLCQPHGDSVYMQMLMFNLPYHHLGTLTLADYIKHKWMLMWGHYLDMKYKYMTWWWHYLKSQWITKVITVKSEENINVIVQLKGNVVMLCRTELFVIPF